MAISRSLRSNISIPLDSHVWLNSHYCLIVTYMAPPNIFDAPLWDIGHPNLSDLNIYLSRSLNPNVIILLDSLYMVSYYGLLVTYVLSWLFYGIYAFKDWVTLTLTLQGHSRSNDVVLLDSPYVISYCYWWKIVNDPKMNVTRSMVYVLIVPVSPQRNKNVKHWKMLFFSKIQKSLSVYAPEQETTEIWKKSAQ